MMEGKKDTDKWFPLRLLDSTDGKSGETGKGSGDVTVTYCYEAATEWSAYAAGAGDWKESGNGGYWLSIGASEFSSEGKYMVKIVCPGCLDVFLSVEVKDRTEAENDDDVVAIKAKTDNIPASPAPSGEYDTEMGRIDQSLSTTESNIITEVDANETKIDALNDLSAAQVNAECDTALSDYDPPTRAELTTDKDTIITEIDANETKIDNIVALLTRALGLVQENYYIDNTTYNDDNLLLTGRIRIYDSASNVGTDNGVIGTYNIEASYNDDGELETYKVTKE